MCGTYINIHQTETVDQTSIQRSCAVTQVGNETIHNGVGNLVKISRSKISGHSINWKYILRNII